ncbi:MAG: NADH-quinone oxidoreductase subunit H [Calditrichaeota bacterium]|nr:NADH-quinone oxidoreductase subunit H [Calditrichota bacterium]
MSEIGAFLLEKTVVGSVMFGVTLGVVAYATLGERKLSGFFQDRHGPNRAGPWGLFQPIADGVKFFTKEEFIPDRANKALFVIAPTFTFMAAGFLIAVIPFGDRIVVNGREILLQIADVNIGILYILAISSLGVYGVITGGWASNNKYSLMGGLRSSSQMISYEIAMGLAVVALLIDHGTLSLRQIVLNQTGPIWQWSVFTHPLGFIIFYVSAFAEAARIPFDLPEAENELVGGYHTEYSAMKFGLFQFGEYTHMTLASGLIATLYFGGWSIPWLTAPAEPTVWWGLLTFAVFWIKTFFFMFVFIWVRWTLPRFRYDQLMGLGWKKLIPLAVLNILAMAAILIATGGAGME